MPSFVSTKADMIVNGILPIDHMRDFVPPVTFISLSNYTSVLVAFHAFAFSALTLLVGWQERQLACKKLSGGMLVWLCVWVKVQICKMTVILPLLLFSVIIKLCQLFHSLSLVPVNTDWFYFSGAGSPG